MLDQSCLAAIILVVLYTLDSPEQSIEACKIQSSEKHTYSITNNSEYRFICHKYTVGQELPNTFPVNQHTSSF